MVRKDGVKLLSAWMAIVLAALPVLTPSLFTASSWKTYLFFVSFSQIHVKNVHKCVDSRLVINLRSGLQEWEPPTARHGALLESLHKTRPVSSKEVEALLCCLVPR